MLFSITINHLILSCNSSPAPLRSPFLGSCSRPLSSLRSLSPSCHGPGDCANVQFLHRSTRIFSHIFSAPSSLKVGTLDFEVMHGTSLHNFFAMQRICSQTADLPSLERGKENDACEPARVFFLLLIVPLRLR